LDVPPYNVSGGQQGSESMYLMQVGERLGTIYGRSFVTKCSQLPGSFASDCGSPTSAFQQHDDGYIVWTGGRPITQGFTHNYYQAQLPVASAPWEHRLNWGMPIVLRDSDSDSFEPVVGALGNASPDYHVGVSSNFSWNRFTAYGLLDGVFGRDV